ncbi:MAG: DoxX family protein [Propionibacteriaceae bacterium]
MTLFRAFARTLLASQFVVSGFKAVKDPQAYVPAAQPLVDRWMPLVKKYAPDQIEGVIPDDTATLVRINGALELFGGLALASGKGRRLGSALLAISLVPATVVEYPFWSRDTAEEKATDRALFLKNVSLLGGVLLAARDTEGKPGLVWRAQSGGKSIAKDTKKATKQLTSSSKGITDSAIAEGAALVSAVVAQSRRTKKKAAKQLKVARAAAEKQAEAAQKAAKRASKDAKKRSKPLQKSAEKKVESIVAAASDGLDTAKKVAADQLETAQKSAHKVAKNIQLGTN